MGGAPDLETAIRQNPPPGRLVRFLAGLYNGYPFDLTDLRTLDTKLANACLDYLNYDRLVSKRCVTISSVESASCRR